MGTLPAVDGLSPAPKDFFWGFKWGHRHAAVANRRRTRLMVCVHFWRGRCGMDRSLGSTPTKGSRHKACRNRALAWHVRHLHPDQE